MSGGHKAPCRKCRAPTVHSSDICEPCRTTTCLRCKKTFIARKLGLTRCGQCRMLRASAFDTSGATVAAEVL